MYYGGIDAHRSYLTVAIMDSQGSLVQERKRVPIGADPILEALAEYRPLEVVVETCPFWPWIHDVLAPTEIGFHLAHAKELEAIAKAETKTDSVDARLLARMLAANLIPEVYPKPAEQREILHLVRHRAALVKQRTALAGRIHSHLHQQGLQMAREQLLSKKGRRWLQGVAWPSLSPEQQALMKTHLELIDLLSRQIKTLNGRVRDRAAEHPGACLLQTIPGIGCYRSLVLAGEIEPISPLRRARSSGFLCRACAADSQFGRQDTLREHAAGGQPLDTRSPGLGDPQPHALDTGELAGRVLRATEGTNRVAEGPCGCRPQAVPGDSRHALYGRSVARTDPVAIRRIGASSLKFMRPGPPSSP